MSSSDAALCASDAALCIPARGVGSVGLFFWLLDLWLIVTVSLTLVFCFYLVFGADRADSGWRRKFVLVAGWGAGMFALTAVAVLGAMSIVVWVR